MSAILSADDLNDFISPGVACIKPIETLPTSSPPPSDPNAYEVSFNTERPIPQSDLPPAQISLTDCLACSGCVTSAEAVLVSLQSHAEVLSVLDAAPGLRLSPDGLGIENLDTGSKIFVASVSPQSRASIAATYGVTEQQAGNMIEQLLCGPRGLKSRAVYRNGFQWVVDINAAREACLVLGADELMGPILAEQGGTDGTNQVSNGEADIQSIKPILTSSCPGWVCYAEKTHPYVLPHLSRLKSPQALMGTLLKTTISRRLGISPDRIWHVAVMPCFDKKLEASREELTNEAWENTATGSVRDVDCVITSKELLMLADSRRVDFSKLPRTPLASRAPFPDAKLHSFLYPPPRWRKNGDAASGTSGGNLHYILKHFAAQFVGASVQTTRGRNVDVQEYTVTSATGEILLKGARYYGFRNIQNLVRRLKPAKSSRLPGGRPGGPVRKGAGKATGLEYAYVEVMACPGGCTNGGGQIKVDDPVVSGRQPSELKAGPQEQKAWLAQIDEAYWSSEDKIDDDGALDIRHDIVDGISPSYVKDTLAHWAATTGIDLKRLAYTSYREVVSDVGKKVGETERVIEIAGKIGGGW
ncbi:Fe-only hydrogenase [Glarea lozoyensis ATCC 20868]|uniref:Nuclear architecture-related protein 1 n=1 Tax=Glarea lozoyensis (strain ATCC 20868 / MF5171) TaxID=1116229 RepID=S3CJ48_GLAL2|nr:Fe-only hydrogenase [Glarea lozoyensis ATCC 20868]EPE25254.1 Fe-only hydrogenase [Glarea lozoyensis ATCC 20868]